MYLCYSSERPMTNFVEATNCHHHYFWQATHASDGDQVYMEEELGDDQIHCSYEQSGNDDDNFQFESDGSGVDNDSDGHHYFDNGQDDTDTFFDHHRHHSGPGGGGGGGGGYGRAMILPSSGRIER